MDELLKYGIDAMVWAMLLGVILNWLPVISVMLGILWHCYQIFDLYERRKRHGKGR